MSRYEDALKNLEAHYPANTKDPFNQTSQFHRYERARTNIIRNRQMIEACEQILIRHANEKDHHEFNDKEIQRVTKMLNRMCNGLNLAFTQFLFLVSYGGQPFISP